MMKRDETEQTPDKTERAEYDTPARVVLDARYLNGSHSGIGRYTENLIRHMLELDSGLRLHLITHPDAPNPVPHPRVTTQTFWGAPNGPMTRLVLPRFIDWDDVDLFHSPFNSLPAGVPVPEVYTLHDIMWIIEPDFCMPPGIGQFFSKWYYKLVMPASVAEADRIFTVSHASREAIEEQFPDKRGDVYVSYNAVDDFFHPVAPEEGWPLLNEYVAPKTKFVLIVGQGSPYKNHEGAVEGFIEAFADDPEIYMVIVRRLSRAPSEKWQRMLSDPRVASRIIKLDYVSGEELRALYSLARAFVFPSFYEGFGLPQLEAMACGTPSVTSNFGAMAEVGGEAAVKVDPHSAESIGEGLKKLVYDDGFYRERRQMGLERAAEFTWDEAARKTIEAYRELL
ncbi:MAG: glycosyltransferase family 4 protein [Myxococcota bacterium]